MCAPVRKREREKEKEREREKKREREKMFTKIPSSRLKKVGIVKREKNQVEILTC